MRSEIIGTIQLPKKIMDFTGKRVRIIESADNLELA